MKNINGYLFIATFGGCIHLYGKALKPNTNQDNYDIFFLNDLTPYENENDSRKCGKFLFDAEEDIKSVKFARLEMKVAENEKEIDELGDGKLVIITSIVPHEHIIYGPFNPKYPESRQIAHGHGCRIEDNGLQTFSHLGKDSWDVLDSGDLSKQSAKHCAYEILRQTGGISITIAKFNLNFLSGELKRCK